jgi:O-antigen/teichoic acid export membrane protein
LGSVTFPTLSKLQDDDNALRNGYRRILRISSFIVFPLCLGMGSVAYPLIHTLYTDKWIYAASLLQIIVFYMMWYPIHAINLNLLIVKGRSDLFFRLEVIKKIVGVIMLCITVPIGLKAMCYGGIVSCFIGLFLNTHYTGKLLNLGFFTQLKDYWPSLLLSLVMFVIVSTLARIMGNSMLSLIVCIAVCVVFYLGAAIIFRMPELDELKRLRK